MSVSNGIWREKKGQVSTSKLENLLKNDSVKCGIGLQGSQTEVEVQSKP